MSIWTGFGLVVPVIVLLVLLLVGATVDMIHGPDYFHQHLWPTSFVLALSAPLVWLAGHWLRQRGTAALGDLRREGCGHRSPRHSLFLLRVDHWAAVLLAAALLITWL